jgi:hypothetical protein
MQVLACHIAYTSVIPGLLLYDHTLQDPGYSIVNECFPYLARRLLTEDSPRMHKMLRTFLVSLATYFNV